MFRIKLKKKIRKHTTHTPPKIKINKIKLQKKTTPSTMILKIYTHAHTHTKYE